MRISRIVFAALLAAGCTFAAAQNTPASKANVPPAPNLQPVMDQMYGMFDKMTDALVSAQLRAASKPEVAEGIAAYKRNLYEALVKKGFRPEEALQIVIATPLPSAAVNAK